ncbi:MAG: dockerin type I repeat-containing protein, partial [Clostridia bacterium]|nr:dockerin type I repeat-containing protein [Clostridia bacterium]
PGDIDGNGEIEVSDAILALRSAMGIIELTPEQLAAGDMNGDGTVGVDDALTILRTAMGLIG